MAMTKQFTKTQWNNDREPAITAEQLNRMEKGIDVNDTRIVELDKAVTENKNSGDKSLEKVNKTLQKHTEDITAVNNELTLQSKAIGELADKKITKFYASSQGESTLNDSDNGKMQDIMLYGKSEQKQYSGKNLLNYNVSVDGRTVQSDGTIKSDVTSDKRGWTYSAAEYKLSLDAGTYTIIINVLTASDSASGRVQVFLSDGTNLCDIKNAFLSNTVGIFTETFTLSSDASIGILCKPYKASFTIQIEKGSEATSFEPYVGGIPSPNPDYPQEIKSVVNPTVKVTGKNLVGKLMNGIIDGNNGNYNPSIAGYKSTDYIPVKTGEKYIFSNSTKGAEKWYYDKTKKTIKNITTGGGAITIPENVAYIRVSCLAENADIFQIEKGSTATAYEPYHEQSVTLTGVTLNAIPVSSDGNVTIDGQQYISDYVDVERGKIVRMVNNARLLSSYNWYTGDKYYFGSVTGATNSKEPIVADNSKKLCLCNYFVALPMYDILNNVKKGIAINNLKQVTISLEEFASAEDLKTFLANNDVRLVYPLATSTEESLSEELAEKLKALQTYYSQTNLFITSNQLDGYAIFNYPISLANGWNYVKQQIGDTRDYIYDMDLQMAQAYVNSEYAVALTELEV